MKIYCITNVISGKRYIGQTNQTIEERWEQHRQRIGCRALAAAIRKYGADSFSIVEIAAADSQQELDALERAWIARLDTISPNGYNLNNGGRACGVMSDETKAKMRATSSLPEVKARRSLASSGRKHTEEWKIANSIRFAGKKRGPNKNGVGKPRAAMQAHWDNPQWKTMLLAKRRAAMDRQLANLKITNALPETKLRRSLAAAKWQAERKVSRGAQNSAA